MSLDHGIKPSKTDLRIGVLFFDGVEEIDAVGPWEVFGFWAQFSQRFAITLKSVGVTNAPVTCSHGLRIAIDEVVADGRYDIVVWPGGPGARKLALDDDHISLVGAVAESGAVIAAVCTGSLALARAGLLANQRATTHFRALDLLAEYDSSISVEPHARFIDQGATLTSAGISAGIDMALHLVGRFEDPVVGQQIAEIMEYEPGTSA